MAEQKPSAPKARPAAPAAAPAPSAAPATSGASLSGLTEAQAKEFHEQFKVTYTAFVGLAAVAHLFVMAAKPWF